jgi:translation initiation factor RLI1
MCYIFLPNRVRCLVSSNYRTSLYYCTIHESVEGRSVTILGGQTNEEAILSCIESCSGTILRCFRSLSGGELPERFAISARATREADAYICLIWAILLPWVLDVKQRMKAAQVICSLLKLSDLKTIRLMEYFRKILFTVKQSSEDWHVEISFAASQERRGRNGSRWGKDLF